MNHVMRIVLLSLILLAVCLPLASLAAEPDRKPVPATITVTFPLGAATPSEVCGKCHQAIYNEYAHGFGSDSNSKDIQVTASGNRDIKLPTSSASTAAAHALSGVDPFPIHAREIEEDGKSCNVCHFPESFALPVLDSDEVAIPKPRKKSEESGGITCASCHLTPEGKIRAPYNLRAPHENHPDTRMKTSVMCAYCHSLGKRLPGKQTQTYFEWREDYWKKGLGYNCQYCHMPRTNRQLAEEYDVPHRVVARHLWTGGRSLQRLQSALSQTIVQPDKSAAHLEFHLFNIGAGHSVPTGSNRRAVYLQVEAVDVKGKVVAANEWLFAPWYGDRPDDKAFLEEDRKRPDAKAALQADRQGPHEQIIRAGEERILSWFPNLKPGSYTIHSRLVYDINRYNDRTATDDQTVFNTTRIGVTVAK